MPGSASPGEPAAGGAPARDAGPPVRVMLCDDSATVRAALARLRWQGIGRAHAERVALDQARSVRRRGENDAWQVAVAETMEAVLLGHDPKAFERLGDAYEDHRRA
mgnify:CR=1 FL=1